MSAPRRPEADPSAHVVFDDHVAETYDDASAPMFSPARLDPEVAFLAALAGSGRALEFGIGTGRVAIPMSGRGIRVAGIDVSAPMIARLRGKPGASAIDAVVGSCCTTRVPGSFQLVYCVWNTFVNLLTQDEQVQCFENAAAHLAPGGHFVVEAGTPSIQGMLPGERFKTFVVAAEASASTRSTCTRNGCVAPHHDRGRSRLVVEGAVAIRLAIRTRSHGPHRRPRSRRALGHLRAQALRPADRLTRLGWRKRSPRERHRRQRPRREREPDVRSAGGLQQSGSAASHVIGLFAVRCSAAPEEVPEDRCQMCRPGPINVPPPLYRLHQ